MSASARLYAAEHSQLCTFVCTKCGVQWQWAHSWLQLGDRIIIRGVCAVCRVPGCACWRKNVPETVIN